MPNTGTVKIKGALADRVRGLLGGSNPTAARVETLLEELEIRRAIPDDPPPIHDSVGTLILDEALPDTDPDEVDDTDDEEDEDEAEVPPETAPVEPERVPEAAVGLDAIQPTSATEAMLLRLLQAQQKQSEQLQAKLEELLKPREAEDKDRAIGEGKLPVSAAAAPPVGLTGPASFPIGKWFDSPLGPKVKMKVCGCGQCTTYRVFHYYCVVCHRGPFAYQGNQGPRGRKIWTAPGSVWGVSHESCSTVCYSRYMEMIGVVAGVNDHEPIPPVDGEPSDIPDLHALPIGSD